MPSLPFWVQKIRAKISLKDIFLASQLYKPEYILSDQFPCLAGTDGFNVYFRPELEQFPFGQQQTVFAHETMHNALQHPFRRGDRDPEAWNMAADYVINLILVDAGYDPIPGWLYDTQYRGMTTEKVYSIIWPEIQKQREKDKGIGCFPVPGSGNPQPGDDSDGFDPKNPTKGWSNGKEMPDPKNADGGKTDEEIASQKLDWEIVTTSAAQRCKEAGNLAGHYAQFLVPEQAKIPWTTELQEFCVQINKDDYTWRMPNRAIKAATGIYLPALNLPVMGNVALIFDTSGSVTDKQLNMAAGEALDIMDSVRPATTYLAYVDHILHKVEEYNPGDRPILKALGRGGTSFRPFFEYAKQQDLDLVCAIYFTDMESWEWPDEPDYPLLWVSVNKFHNPPPFGRVIYLEE